MNRTTYTLLCALLAALAAVLCVAVATAQTSRPPMQRPKLVGVSPSGLQSAWWYDDLAGSECTPALPGLDVRAGSLTSDCVDADGRARWTFLVEGEVRHLVWRGETVLEDTRHRAALPLVSR